MNSCYWIQTGYFFFFDFVIKKEKRGLEKRVNPAAVQMGAKAGEKAVDMAGKMAEKQMETLEEQKGKVDQFLGEEVCME